MPLICSDTSFAYLTLSTFVVSNTPARTYIGGAPLCFIVLWAVAAGGSDEGRSDSSLGSRSHRSGGPRAGLSDDDDVMAATHLSAAVLEADFPSSGPLSAADADRLRDAYGVYACVDVCVCISVCM